MTDHEPLVTLLLNHGYEERQRVEQAPRNLAEADLSISFQHPKLYWAHINVFKRMQGIRVECVLHPQLLGERTVHRDFAQVAERLIELENRAGLSKPTQVWGK